MTSQITREMLTNSEWRTLLEVLDWERAADAWGPNDDSSRTNVILRLINELRENLRGNLCRNLRGALRALDSLKVVRTETAAHYVKLVAIRPLLRMRVLLRQKLALSEPVVRLVLTTRARRIFATHPPIAPPQFA